MRFVVAVAAVLMVGLPVKAWDTAPLCAFEPPPPLSLPEIAEPETAPMCVLPEPSPAQDLSAETVRESWEAIRLGDEDPEAALLRMSILEEALPRLTDVFLVRRGELLLSMGDARAARQAFANALETPSDSEIGLRARVGRVRALLAMGHRDAVNDLTALLRRYPDLPEEPQLEFDLARMREEAGAQSDAIRTYRRLDIRSPGTDVARQARERLNVLRAEGVEVRALTLAERVARTEKLVARGPLADARVELAELMEEARLGPTHRAKVYFLAARIARHEGRWDDARQLLQRGQGTGAVVGDEDDQARRQQRAENLAQAAVAREREQATRRLRQLRAGRPWGRIGTARVLLMGRVAARAGLTDEVDAALAEIVRRNVPPGLRLRAALELSGAGDDTHILALLEGVHDRPGNIGLQAAYHRARTLHRLGRAAEAEIAFLEVIERDRGITPFYAMWSELQLDDVRASMIGSCLPDATCGDEAAPEASAVSTSASTDASASTDTSNTDASASTVESNPDAHPGAEAPVGVEAMAGASEEHAEQVVQTLPESPLVSLPAKPEGEIGAVVEEEAAPSPNLEAVVANFTPTQPQELDVERAIETLAPLAEEYGDAYPWFGRAHDYLLIGEVDEAGRQLYEAFLAWREASGRPIRRTGRESVARGDNRPRQFLGWELKRKRRELTGEARLALADVGVALGDIGVSTGFGGWDRVAERPRAYAAQVEAAASRHGLDPNLLFAIMRVESVYQKEIVSYAGAIGLCQIMPRTGQLIANSLHRSDYTAADLLDPETNLEFAAWYLRSLIERFDGRVPLAIASYNGGPHNVRQWMASQPEDMPLDVFLEHIPFEQTHRYVRRVLTHYRAYRAQQGLPMISLSTDLPAVRTDTVAF